MSDRFLTGCFAALFLGFLLKAWIEKPVYVAPVKEAESKDCRKEFAWDGKEWRRVQ
jgi:hypothetical protein